jgi:hypothetical protein
MNTRLNMRLTVTMALSLWLNVILATAFAAEKNGREPPRTLEDLLLQAEQMANQLPDGKNIPAKEGDDQQLANQAVPAPLNAEQQPANPQQFPLAVNAINEMQRLIDERNRVVNRSQLFATLRELCSKQPEFDRLCDAVDEATQCAKVAGNQLAVVRRMAMGGGPGPNQQRVAAAQATWNAAADNLRNAKTTAHNFFQAELRPRINRVVPELPVFFANYAQMRKMIPLDRQDPAQGQLLKTLQHNMPQSTDFVEGHILTGILHAYGGDANGAQEAFAQASTINKSTGLAFTTLGYDCCYGLLLIGTPNEISDEYIRRLKEVNDARRTSAVNWLLGAYYFSKYEYNEASKFLYRAFTQAEETASPQLRGEVAWLYLFAKNKRDIKKAEELLKGLDAEPAWQVKRANAGLAAEQGNFSQAVTLMAGCLASAPPHFDAELAQQQNTYKAEQLWQRSPPAKDKKAK